MLSGDWCRIELHGRIVGDLHGCPPEGRIHRSPIAVNAIAWPSGEMTGLTMPVSFCGPAGSRARCAIAYVLRCSDTFAVNGTTPTPVGPSIVASTPFRDPRIPRPCRQMCPFAV